MQHKALPDIRKFALLSNQKSNFYAVIKPAGIDVYILKGQMFDMYNNELQNEYLKFHFEALLRVSKDMKMAIVGTLVSNNLTALLKWKHTFYSPTKSAFTDLGFVVYDIHFPVFDADHTYHWRYDIAKKVVGTLPGCKVASYTTVKDELELSKAVADVFTIDTSASIIVYKEDGTFIPGISQLTYEQDDVVSYIISANQRYRAHINRMVSTTLRMENGNKLDVALFIRAKFKKALIEIPVPQNNLVLRQFLWNHKETLKDRPFWFTGFTILIDGEYVTLINEFLSFINTNISHE